MELAFVPLRRADFALLSRWLTAPLVSRWWAEPADLESIEREYGPRVDGTDLAPTWIVHLEGRPVAMIQWYRYSDEPEYLAEVGQFLPVPDNAVSIDYLIGAESAVGRGVGPAMIDQLVRLQWEREPDTGDAVVPVHADNRRSWRALEKAGFEHLTDAELDPDNPVDDRRHRIMVRRRPPR
ncbi:GNAT family N-acetyltransferase [Ruania alba]|uniref:Lysine N-acyltransferase MbtK n=1 Tax=Ruania alba TaxID=648782 RepID=A0A1H5MZ29_9MICO|nr:GNAT family N-acetyltransferase [Ruania alba]SEE94516.1 aminoglycoside 6'-N-acetyltransferase [Ruania alba]